MEWIAIKYKKPPLNTGVLISDGKKVTCACYNKYDFSDDITLDGHEFGGEEWEWHFEEETITHWAYLPEPPILDSLLKK